MNKRTSRESSSTKAISSTRDVRIACYDRDNYKLKGIKAKALACFVQIAIRRDIRACINAMPKIDDPSVMMQGHLEIYNKMTDLNRLIRQRHIIDESDLATIGLSLYNFPTLSRFFVAIEKHAFVREATTNELRNACSGISLLVRASRLGDRIPGDKNCMDADDSDVFSLVNQMTASAIEQEAGLDASNMPSERFLFVDMAAPVTILKQQFLKLIDRQAPLKRNNLADWEDHGILPYLDLRQWESESVIKIKAQTRADLICRNGINGFTAKKIDETIRPYVEKLMDEDGPVIRGLTADASEEFWETIFYVRGEQPDGNSEMADEALARWFPRTYPDNLPDLQRYAEMYPERGVVILKYIEASKERAQVLPMRELIRNMNIEAPGTGMLRAAEKMHVHYPDLSPSCYDTCEDISDETAEDEASKDDVSMDEFYAYVIRDMGRRFATHD